MRKNCKLVLTCLLCLVGGGLQAKVLVVTPAKEGSAAQKVNLFVETKIILSEQSFDILSSPDATPVTFNYADTHTITFGDGTAPEPPVSDIEPLEQAGKLRLAQNPVLDYLRIEGHEGQPAHLQIANMSGNIVFSATWQGEILDVSALKPGFYFVVINSQTIKFIKK